MYSNDKIREIILKRTQGFYQNFDETKHFTTLGGTFYMYELSCKHDLLHFSPLWIISEHFPSLKLGTYIYKNDYETLQQIVKEDFYLMYSYFIDDERRTETQRFKPHSILVDTGLIEL